MWTKACCGAVRLLAAAAMATASWWAIVMCSEFASWLPWVVGVPLAIWGLLLSMPPLFDGWRDGWLERYLLDAPFVWWQTLVDDKRDGSRARLWHVLVWLCTWPTEVVICAMMIVAVCIHTVFAWLFVHGGMAICVCIRTVLRPIKLVLNLRLPGWRHDGKG